MRLENVRDDVERRTRRLLGRRTRRRDVPVERDESRDEFVLRAHLPGYSRRDLDVTIYGQRVQMTAGSDRVGGGERRRTVRLPDPIDDRHATAEYVDDVLTVRIPKRERPSQRERGPPTRPTRAARSRGGERADEGGRQTEPRREPSAEPEHRRPMGPTDEEIREYEAHADQELERQRDFQRDKSGRQYRRK